MGYVTVRISRTLWYSIEKKIYATRIIRQLKNGRLQECVLRHRSENILPKISTKASYQFDLSLIK